MASTTPLEIVDDDEFDWEAAVHEIDVACQTTITSTSLPIEHFNQVTPRTLCSTTDKKPANSRQSTLDKFMGMAGPRPRMENQNSRDQNQYNVEADERMSCVKIDAEAANTWIYPVNYSPRDYQFSITQTALFSNTLAVLPTGLGKTLIAAVVMYNYFRWFPEGKIVFAAPSRPLVMQQLKACHKIVGIPQEWTIDMTGQTSPSIRAGLWKAKRVFFLTPQVLEKDIQSGTCLVKRLVCLVIDEAHRATGNYSYCVAVRELMAVRVQLRILGLTATPGSNKQKVQEIIDNLQISTLEYRNESDHEVLPYVHDRKIKLIEVAMGPDAVEVYNLLLEVIRPIVARLCTIGVLPKRDIQTWSPCALLDSREKFRQARPEDLHHMKSEEVDGYFGVLITLYHIRKSLSNYGIKRAFDMLEEKLQKGFLARFLSRNEVLLKAKFLMQQSLSRGDLSPKLAKMLEVLIDHFKMKDSQNSRVIIFTNLRGSVRDIIDALANIRDIVKPTEFIGQSSGKTLKGQSQKVQQAVLEKFRAGQYNVIVATSIGEEGLDIMEVDLVICFDANVSSLRMIQRMGRTGRNNEGQVVILACEGSELKGYEHKQKKSKTMNKHMRNGGMNSFNFHSSPRMIPHIFKPEVQHVKLAIEQFVPRGKKVKDDNPIQTPLSKVKLTNADTELIKKYFHPSRGNTWRPSLIAFPHFQEFPSRVHEVMHSFRTGMLIDAMEILQGLSFSRNIKDVFVEDEAVSNLCLGVETAEQHDSMKDLQISHDSPENNLLREVSDSGVLPMETSRNKETHCMQDFQGQNPPIHSYLFGSDFVSVDALGRVLVVSVPLLPLVQVSHSKCASASNSGLQNYLKQDSFHFRASLGDSKETVQVKGISRVERILQTAVFNGNLSNRGDSSGETPNVVENKMPLLAADESRNDLRDVELSPRLTDFIKSGVVPESPVDDTGILEGKGRDDFMVPDFVSPPKLDNELLLKSSIPNEKAVKGCCASGIDVPASSINDEIRTPVLSVSTSTPRRCITAFPIVEEIGTPLPNLSNNSCSKDWRLSSGDKSESVEQVKKLKRLCKYGDLHRRPPKGKEDIIGPTANMSRSCTNTSPDADKRGKGEKKLVKDARAFIEEEAEVSSEDMVSDDEEDEHDNNSYDDSFIDDRINPTASSTQAEASRKDMMAIYRRSLLTQSPMERLPNFFADVSPDSVVPMTHANESGSSAGTTNHRLQTPSIGLESTGRNSTPFKLNPDRISSEAMSCTTNGAPRENASKIESRKRKLSFYQAGSIPIHNLEQEFLLHSEAAEKNSSLRDPVEKIEACGDPFDDDEFYQTIDLDAVEEQAAKLLKYKSELSVQKKATIPQPIFENNGILGSPSFDLGI